MMADYVVLPASEVAVGHCVILNDYDAPASGTVAVVVSVEGDDVACEYLSEAMGKSHRPLPMERGGPTPIALFGVEVRFAGGKFWCHVVGDSRAKYRNGTPRRWQESAAKRIAACLRVAALTLEVANRSRPAFGAGVVKSVSGRQQSPATSAATEARKTLQIGERKEGVPSQDEMYKLLKDRSKELQ